MKNKTKKTSDSWVLKLLAHFIYNIIRYPSALPIPLQSAGTSDGAPITNHKSPYIFV